MDFEFHPVNPDDGSDNIINAMFNMEKYILKMPIQSYPTEDGHVIEDYEDINLIVIQENFSNKDFIDFIDNVMSNLMRTRYLEPDQYRVSLFVSNLKMEPGKCIATLTWAEYGKEVFSPQN